MSVLELAVQSAFQQKLARQAQENACLMQTIESLMKMVESLQQDAASVRKENHTLVEENHALVEKLAHMKKTLEESEQREAQMKKTLEESEQCEAHKWAYVTHLVQQEMEIRVKDRVKQALAEQKGKDYDDNIDDVDEPEVKRRKYNKYNNETDV